MTVAQARASSKMYLSATDVAEIMEVQPYTVNVMAREGRLPFRFFFAGDKGRRLKILRQSVIDWLDGKPVNTEEVQDHAE